jgi:hypothetical protein
VAAKYEISRANAEEAAMTHFKVQDADRNEKGVS